MEVWRELGVSVLGPLFTVGIRTNAPDSIEHGIYKLGMRTRVLHHLREGFSPDQIDRVFEDIVLDRPPVRACPTVFLEGALRWVAEEVALHAMAGRVLSLYRRAHPGVEGTPRWQRLCLNHNHVVDRAEAGLQMLRFALAKARASNDAERVAGTSFPRLTAGWDAWMAAAEQLADLARVDARVAMDHVRAMRQIVLSEGADVWTIVLVGHGHG